MRHAVAMLVWLGLIMGCGVTARAQNSGAMVLAIHHAVESTGDRISIELNGAHLPKIFMMEGDNPRLVLDFPNCGFNGSSPGVAPGSKLVKRIRVGLHAEPQQKTRLVVDLTPGRKLTWQRDFLAQTNVLHLVLSAAEQELPPPPVSDSPPESPVVDSVADTAMPPVAQQAEPVLLRAESVKVRVSGIPTTDEDPVVTEPDQMVLDESAVTTVHAEPMESEAAQDGQPPPAEPPVEVQPESPITDTAETAGSSPPAGPPVLMNVSFDNAFSQSGEMVLLQLSAFQPPVITTQEKSPPRIFCDFDGAVVDDGAVRDLAANGRYVEKVQVVTESQRVRVVLDLVPGANYDLQQVYFKEDNLFVLIVNLLKE
jgi:AMIN domain